MILKEYLEQLNNLVELHPEVLEMPVICSADDEGNSFDFVHYTASIGHFNPVEKEFSVFRDAYADDDLMKVVCLN